MNLLKKYYSMSTLEKLDKVDLQILSKDLALPGW